MKLSKKIGFTYIIALILGTLVCISFFLGFLNGTRDGERLRSAEKSKGVRFRIDAWFENIEEKGNVIKNVLEKNKVKDLNKEDLFSKELIEFSEVINVDTGSRTDIFNTENTYEKKYDEILAEVIQCIKKDSKEEDCGFLITDTRSAIVYYSKLNNKKEYLILISDISNEFLSYIGASTNSKVSITDKVGENLLEKESTIENVRYSFEEAEEYIYSYSTINTLNQKQNIYLKVRQVKEVEKNITMNYVVIMCIVFMILLGVNGFMYLFINRNLIRRIVFMNKTVHKIYNDESDIKQLPVEHVQDEITSLTDSINEMLVRINTANTKVMASETKYKTIINKMTNGFVFCKVINHEDVIDSEVIDINDAALNILQLDKNNNSLLSSIFRKVESERRFELAEILKNSDTNSSIFYGELKFPNNRWGVITITVVEKGYFFIIINEVTKIKLYSEEMSYLANYDYLTSIYNRRKLLTYIDDLEKNNISFNFFYMDLDNFKRLNDTLGHEKGDFLLKEVAKDLCSLKNEFIKVGRLGGDEFVVIVQGDYSESELVEFGKKIIKAISKKYNFDKFIYEVKTSIGIARYPKDGTDSDSIIKFADIAMYNSKQKGTNIISIFNDEIREEYELENKIKDDIGKNKFIPYFQPIYNIKTKNIDGAEALIRWNSDSGIIMPSKFLSVAKRNGLMADLDKNIFIAACRFCCKWKRRFGEYITISVNISNSLLVKKEFVQFILETVEGYNIPYEFIKLEITEDEIIRDIKYVVSILDYMKDKGIKIALDDFGTGYSTYSYINTLPLDVIKIDRSLILNIENDAKVESIIKSLIELSKSLGLETICEGIEKESQLKMLSEIGCDKIQGYLFSKPIPEKDLFKYVDEFNEVKNKK